MARRATARTRPSWMGDLPVFERTLANGLKALVLPRRHVPIAVCDLFYPVGSADEPTGRTGLAHFVEHMLFKGTERFPKGQIDHLALIGAGQANAETSEDCTHYWFAFPAERWELALAIEADRMAGALFGRDEVEAERRVIAEERARELDSPVGRLDQTHLTVSYQTHPYRNPILGWPDDLERIAPGDLRAFYRAHYRPDGAVLVVVGDVDPGQVLDRIEAHFGPLRPGDTERPRPMIGEPRQTHRRDFHLVEPELITRGLFGWHSVPQGHPDAPALAVLADLLTCGRRSRLWDRLVERDRLATWVDAAHEDGHLAGQFLLQVEAAPRTEPARIEAAVHDVLTRLAHEGPTAEELVRSRHRLEAAWRWEQEDLVGLASGLGHVALWDDWRAWQDEHRAALAVGADDILRVMRDYLDDSILTVGWSVPKAGHVVTMAATTGAPGGGEPVAMLRDDAGTAAVPKTSQPPHDAPALVSSRSSKLTDYRPRRSALPNGLRILTERRPGTGVVALELFADAGRLREAQPGVAYLTGRLREEGTLSRSADALAEAVEDIGGVLEIGPTGPMLRVRAEDLPLAVELLADLVLRPAFPADALAWTRRRIAAELQSDLDDPAFRAEALFRELIYGDHPYARDPRGSLRQIARLTRDDVRAHHERCFTPDNAILVAVGDFEPRRLRSLVNAHLGGWAAGGLPAPALPGLLRSARPRVRRVARPGEQVHILMGHLGVTRLDPDYGALLVLDHILGSGPGFTDRLSRILRDELGLAYAVGGGVTDSADREPGLFRVYVGTGPDEADLAIEAVAEQVRAMHRGDFSDEEVDHARRYLAGAWVFDFQTVEQRAERLLELERWGLPLDEPKRWPERIARITPDQVRLAARRHLDPAALVRVEYGPIRRRARRRSAECA